MSVFDFIKEGLQIVRTHKSLWVFGFVAGLGNFNGGGDGAGGGGGNAPQDGLASVGALGPVLPVIAAGVVAVILAVVIIRFISEGALIEGVTRARRGRSMTVREGIREGWAHWGVLLRIAIVYFAVSAVSAALLAAPVLLTARFAGWAPAALVVGIPAIVIATPWLVTLYMLQAFASRIAVLENRQAMDAIRKARLFLHGRLLHGLRLLVAAFLGSLLLAAGGIIALVPAALILAGIFALFGVLPTIAFGIVGLLPIFVVIVATIGTLQSSVWTIGYLSEAAR